MKSHTIAGIKLGPKHPPRIMGVINVSKESFFKKSVFQGAALSKAAKQMEKEGADIIDVGAMSTAPYLKTEISEKEETKRLTKAIKAVRKASSLPISADTSRAQPAAAALKAGATIINDVYGLRRDEDMAHVAKKAKGLILMANPWGLKEKGFSKPIADTKKILNLSLRTAEKARISKTKIIIDPGVGFFRKTALPWWKWDLTVIKHLSKLTKLGHPILMGLSRKSFIGHLSGGKPAEERLYQSLALSNYSILAGASIIRTHDVAVTRKSVNALHWLNKGKS